MAASHEIERRAHLVAGLLRYATRRELEESDFYSARGGELEALLGTAEIAHCAAARPRINGFVRVVQWNIEKGRHFEGVLACLRDDPVLGRADLILLNEADVGMSRSGNRHVARELAGALGMHAVFGPAHLELPPGDGDDRLAGSENRESLQGNAILSRFPVLEARVVGLPMCFEPYHFHERRYGRRACVWARLRAGRRDWWVGSIHLEVRDTPRCRLRQVEHLLGELPGAAAEPHLLGGDLNSNGFARGNRSRTLLSAWRLLARPAARVKADLLRPQLGTEPLFQAFLRAGFAWKGFNGDQATAVAPLDDLEDAVFLPDWLRRAIRARLARYDHSLDLKLDWLLGRGILPLIAGEVRNSTGLDDSLDAGCRFTARTGPDRISDHVPIYADLALEA